MRTRATAGSLRKRDANTDSPADGNKQCRAYSKPMSTLPNSKKGKAKSASQRLLEAFLADCIRARRDDMFMTKEVAHLCHSIGYELEELAHLARMMQVARFVLQVPQEIRGIRGWACLSRFASAALVLNDRLTLNLISECAESGETNSDAERLCQVLIMCMGNRALPGQVKDWTEYCKDEEVITAAHALCRAAQVAHRQRDTDALKGLLQAAKMVIPKLGATQHMPSQGESVELALLQARFDDLSSGRPKIEALCEMVCQLHGKVREKYCRDIAATFPRLVTGRRCAICRREYGDLLIYR